MATKDTVVQELVVNTLTHKQFKAAQEAGTLSPYELYGTPDTSVRLPVLTPMWFDHITNDVSWLRADTFSWQSGDVYVAAYEHLTEDIDGAIIETETIADITITFYRAEDGHKICLPDQESNISALYESTGVAWYYLLDTENKQFKLPRSKHNKYADTLGVVGTGISLGLTDGSNNFGLVRSEHSAGVRGSAYGAAFGQTGNQDYDNYRNNLGVTEDPTKSGVIAQQAQDTDQYKYLYFYVGNFEQDAIEQTAGLNAELFNGKADSDLKNIPANYDYVVESQMPTAENGYTWYRKYKSGWVEQGGRCTGNIDYTIAFMVPFADTNYIAIAGLLYSHAGAICNVGCTNFTTTSMAITIADNTQGNNRPACWQASGMSA